MAAFCVCRNLSSIETAVSYNRCLPFPSTKDRLSVTGVLSDPVIVHRDIWLLKPRDPRAEGERLSLVGSPLQLRAVAEDTTMKPSNDYCSLD